METEFLSWAIYLWLYFPLKVGNGLCQILRYGLMHDEFMYLSFAIYGADNNGS